MIHCARLTVSRDILHNSIKIERTKYYYGLRSFQLIKVKE